MHHRPTLHTDEYRALSLLARLAVALRAVEGFFVAKRLEGVLFTEFLDHWWELPAVRSFPDWEAHHDELLAFGLGDPLPLQAALLLQRAGVSEESLRKLIAHTAEVIYGSAYAASDDAGSLRELAEVLHICQAAGVPRPPARLFADSLFVEGQGWGAKLSPEQRDRWRCAAYDAPLV